VVAAATPWRSVARDRSSGLGIEPSLAYGPVWYVNHATEPVVRWTPAEGWLIAELAKRSLVAELDGAPAIAGSDADGARFHVEIHASAEAIVLELRIDAARARIALAPSSPAGHRWRDGWMLEVIRGDERWMLSSQIPAFEVEDARRAALTVELRLQHRAVVRELDGVTETVPVTDVAFHRYTRQSTVRAVETTLAPWASSTEYEVAPWWELDLGKAMHVVWLRIDLIPPPPGTRVVIRAYGFVMPSGTPPPHTVIFDQPAEELPIHEGSAWIAVPEGVVARYLHVELASESRVSLAITAAEILASEIHADTLEATLRLAFALYRDRPLFVTRADAGYVPSLTYGEVWARAMAVSRGLATKLEPKADRIVLGVMLRNRPEWVMADLAALVRGYVIVPISPDDIDDRLAQVLALAKPTCVICEPADAERVARLAVASPPFTTSFEAIADAPDAPPPVTRGPDELYAVLFTSGSTGTPKGAMRTYATFFAMVKSYTVGHSPQHLSFQPLSHLSERMYLPALLAHGGTIAFSRGGAVLLDELRAREPTTIGTVPRLFEVLHASYQRRLRAALAGSSEPRATIEARVLAESRQAFGSRLFAISVGSAPVSAEVLAFLKRCFADIWVSEGYGSTEVGTIASDGKVPEHVKVKLVPLPGTPQTSPTATTSGQGIERGEIYVLSPHAIAGYLGDPAATAAAFDTEGYFATGDLGERDTDGRVRVVGRVRNTVKLAQGEFVSAERIEAALSTAPIVDRIYVHVEHGAAGVAALVVPHAEALAAAINVEGSLAALAAHPAAPPAVFAAIRAQARAAGLAAYEVPRGIVLEGAPLSIEDGTLTPSGKLARGAIAKRYGVRLAAIAAGEVPAIDVVDIADDDMLARVTRAASRILGRAVDPKEPIGTGVGVDSLAAAEILEALSDDLGREVPLAWWFEASTLDELATRLARFADAGATAANADQATADLALPTPAIIANAPRAIRTVLVTGATGFLGAHLVESLRARELDVVCLVRAPDDAAATTRLAAALAARQVPIAVGPHVRAIAGDLTELSELAPEIDAIIHAGATVSWLASYPALRAPNVLGTHALLAQAARRGLPVHYISTISTAARGGDETTRLALELAIASTPYALSKWIAEQHVHRAAAAGLPAAVYRPAMIAGHSRRGIGNRDDFLNRYMVGCAELGLYVDRDDAIIDMTPVDFVAEAIAALVVARPRGAGATYHLANVDQSLGFGALGRAMIAAGVALAPATYPEFRAALHAKRTSHLHALAAFFPETFSLGMGPWPCDITLAALAELGVARPRIDEAIVARYVAALGVSLTC
jgi:fatty acid CoA ligase FadD9